MDIIIPMLFEILTIAFGVALGLLIYDRIKPR